MKVIASRLTESKQSIPHYYLTVDLKVDETLKYVYIFFFCCWFLLKKIYLDFVKLSTNPLMANTNYL